MHGGWGMARDKPGLSACFFCRVFHGRFSEEETKAGASGNTGLPGGGKTLFREPLGVLLHIASGNSAGLPAYSVLEGLLAGNINILVALRGRGPVPLYFEKLTEYEPRLKEYIYILDTPSGDKRVMEMLMRLAGGIAVWGSDETVRAVRESAPVNVKIIEWGHRLSFCLYCRYGCPGRKT